MCLADHAKDDGTDIYPSLDLIEYKTDYSERQTREILRGLLKRKILEIVHRGGSGAGDMTRMRIVVSNIPFKLSWQEWRRKGAKTAHLAADKGAETAVEGCGNFQISMRKLPLETNTEPSTETNTNTLPLSSKDGGVAASPSGEKKPQKQKLEDPRHGPVREAIKAMWMKHNPGAPAAPWDGRAGKQLDNVLKANPSWEVEKLLTCVFNRFNSEVLHGDHPQSWIPALLTYFAGPINKFKNGKARASPTTSPPAESVAERQKRELLERNNELYLEGKLTLSDVQRFRKRGTLTEHDDAIEAKIREEAAGDDERSQ